MWEEGELTKMQRTIRIWVIVLVGVLGLTATYVVQSQRIAKSGVYNRIVLIKGHVEVIVPDQDRGIFGASGVDAARNPYWVAAPIHSSNEMVVLTVLSGRTPTLMAITRS